jgi:hypothetical protein
MASDKELASDGVEEQNQGSLDQKSLLAICVAIIAGLLVTLVFGAQAKSFQSFATVAAFGTVTASASLLVGGLVGFLFGIPRRLQLEQADSAKARARSDDEGDKNSRSLYGANTNLEQISDWLTKILVGVGLTQIGQIGTLFGNLGDTAAEAMPDFTATKPFFIATIIHFTVSGFLLGYLWTRLYLGRALTEAERTSSLKKKLDRYEQDARALRLAAQQLSVDVAGHPDPVDLSAAIKSASPAARSHIFYRAQDQRWRNWRDELNKPMMEYTIPIFQSLVESDNEQRYHANYGQLGFALKDQRKPDWKAAETNLSRAIAIRGAAQQDNSRYYELNRAICRIMLDQAFNQNKATPNEIQSAIMADLEIAIGDEWIKSWVGSEPAIAAWLKLNKLSLDLSREPPARSRARP